MKLMLSLHYTSVRDKLTAQDHYFYKRLLAEKNDPMLKTNQ